MNERRYTDDEVATIFQRAARAQASGAPVARIEGRTLHELQEIGADVGLPPALVAEAARSLELDPPDGSMERLFLGFPMAVTCAVELDRRLTDDEWGRFVTDLLFDATGAVRTDGPLRQWTRGALHATVEPSGSGDRVRIRMSNPLGRGLMTAGLVLLGLALSLLFVLVFGGDLPDDGASLLPIAFVGAALFGVGALPLPGWAAARRTRIESAIARLVDTPETPTANR